MIGCPMDEKNVLVSLRINKTELQIVLAERLLIVRKDFRIVDRCIAIILRIRKGDAESKIVFYRINVSTSSFQSTAMMKNRS